LAYRRLDLVVAQTEQMAEWLRANTGVRVVVIGNPWLEREPQVEGEPEVRGRHVVLAAGRLSSEKRFDLLLQAFAQAAATRPQWRLVIAGEGPLEADLKHQAGELGVGDRVEFPGRVEHLDSLYASSDIFVLSSLFEGFPNVLLEAMGHGLAVMSFDCPTGPRELIAHEENGLLVPHLDLAALTDTLGRLMDHPALRSRLGEAAREVRTRLSIDRIAQRWLEAASR
jgi:glycosyltransferase involved in cell wall biosynthesis